MGAYFSVRSVKKIAPLPLIDAILLPEPRATLRAGKIMANSFAASYQAEAREAVARAFTTLILRTYWYKIQELDLHQLPLPNPFSPLEEVELPASAINLAFTMGEAASAVEPLAAAYLVSVTYTAMLPDDTRSRLGAYYTPPPLAERLVSMATKAGVDWRTCRILDPACGGAHFFPLWPNRS